LVWFGALRRTRPISSVFGLDRGRPIDRYYIEGFLDDSRNDIRGRVLEIGEPVYTHQFGGAAVTQADVLHVVEGNPQATIVGDLATGQGIPLEAFDCMILTQTLPFVYDMKGVIDNSHRALRSNGVLLATFPGISQISRYDMDRWGDYWRFTTLSAKRLFEAVFPPENVTIASHGNVLASIAFLHGLAVEDLRRKELDYNDLDYPITITVRAVKP